jgi:hypothetical protein
MLRTIKSARSRGMLGAGVCAAMAATNAAVTAIVPAIAPNVRFIDTTSEGGRIHAPAGAVSCEAPRKTYTSRAGSDR